MYGAQNKWCFVPCCTSTSVSTPNKIFISVPLEYSRRRNWFKAARRDMPKSKSTFYCCEDHFNLEEDIENFVRYKLMGGKIILKQTVVPHRFDCQPDKKRASNVPVRTLPVKRARKQLVDEAIAESEKRQQNLPLLVDEAITESDKIQQNLPFTNVEEPVPVLL